MVHHYPQQILTDILSGIKRYDSQTMVVNVDRKQGIASKDATSTVETMCLFVCACVLECHGPERGSIAGGDRH